MSENLPTFETVTKACSSESSSSSTTTEDGDTYNYNYEYNYYYFDVGLQFTPRVGSIFSINTSPFITYVGSAKEAQPNVGFARGKGTAWQPDKEDLPNIGGSLGLTYRYAALYDGYWGLKQYTLNDGEDIFWTDEMPGIPSGELNNSPDDAKTTFERSWHNRHPGDVVNEKGEKEDFFDNDGNGSHPETDGIAYSAPNWFTTNRLKGNMADVAQRLEDGESSLSGPKSIVSAQDYYEWYRDTDVAKQDKDTFNASTLSIPSNVKDNLSDEVLRAIDILGEDILLRDEWVASDAYKKILTYTSYPDGERTWQEEVDFYYYIYSNTSIFDNYINGKKGKTSALTLGNNSLLTQDYVIQSIYRTLGLNCVRSSVYLYADKHYTINNTPLATQLTVALDKVNQIQNRMDVFVTRANLDKYWEKALEDGIVKNSDVTTVNFIDGEYKPWSTTPEKYNVPDGVRYIEEKQIDTERMKHITLAEFCVLLKRLMHIYGEEVLTEKEQDMLLVYNGTKLPYYLTDTEQFEAIKYLMAKGIVDDQMLWTGDLRVEDMLVILSRVKDKDSRLTYKELDLVYDESLLDMGFYPANITPGFEDPDVEIVGAINDEVLALNGDTWVDYYIHVDDKTMFMRDGAKVPLNEIYLSNTDNEDANKLAHLKGFEVVEEYEAKNGTHYLHFKVQMKLMFETDEDTNTVNLNQLNETYVYKGIGRDSPAGNYLMLNTGSNVDNPMYLYVPIGGGIYDTYQEYDVQNTDRPAYTYLSQYYYSNGGVRTKIMSATPVNLESERIMLSDTVRLEKYHCYPSTVTEVTSDGYVKTAMALTYNGTRPSAGKDVRFYTFNDQNFGLDKLDFERIFAKYAIQLHTDPYLSDKKESSLFSMIPTYSIFFKVAESKETLGTSTVKLNGDIKWGNDIVVEADSPTSITDRGKELGFICHSTSPGFVTYCINGAKTLKEVNNNLHVSGTVAEAIPAYTKQNNTFLIDSDTLKTIITDYNAAKEDQVRHVNISEYSDDLILISYELCNTKLTKSDAIVNNIYLMKSLKLVAVNNYIYKVPNDEVLFVKKNDGGYLFNFRVAIGWLSGFTYDKNTVGDDGSISLNLSTRWPSGDTIRYEVKNITNLYTLQKERVLYAERDISTYDEDGSADPNAVSGTLTSIPLTSAYPLANYFVYESGLNGTYLFVVKNNAKGAIAPTEQYDPDGALTGTPILDNAAENPVLALYRLGANLMDSTLGVRFTDGEDGMGGSNLVAAYELKESNTDFVVPYKSVLACQYDVAEQNKDGVSCEDLYGMLYYDTVISAWAYIVPVYDMGGKSLYTSLGANNPGAEYITSSKLAQKVSADLVTSYYNDVESKYPLPFVTFGSLTDSYGIFNFSSNIYEVDGQEYYGLVPNYAVARETNNKRWAVTAEGKGEVRQYYNYGFSTALGYFVKSNDNIINPSKPAPIAVTAAVLGVPTLSLHDIGSVNSDNTAVGSGSFLQFQFVYDGNIRYVLEKNYYKGGDNPEDEDYVTPDVDALDGKTVIDHGIVYMSIPDNKSIGGREPKFIANSDPCTLIGMSTGKIMLSKSVIASPFTDNRQTLEDITEQASLKEISQPVTIDWNEFTFNRLIHDIDNGFSILLILVLNFLPRAAMFIFVIMIGLSTIANIHVWRQFCINVFDPYKLVTFGHSDVLTINTKTLLISSIIGLAVFALFMDGTIIHLLTWIVQFFSGIAVR